MAYVITQKCLGEQYATCVSSCPVDCMYPGTYQGKPFMVIDPEICIDCGLCLPECPVGAITEDEDEAPDWTMINEDLAPTFRSNPRVPERPRNEPPRMPGNVIVNP